MARCGDCKKFVGIDDSNEPEVTIDVDGEGHVSGDVQITNACSECGTELRTASMDVNVEPSDIHEETGQSIDDYVASLTDEQRSDLEFTVDDNGSERTSRTEGKGRGAKTFYGAKVEFEVTAKLGGVEKKFSGTWTDDVQASSMDEC